MRVHCAGAARDRAVADQLLGDRPRPRARCRRGPSPRSGCRRRSVRAGSGALERGLGRRASRERAQHRHPEPRPQPPHGAHCTPRAGRDDTMPRMSGEERSIKASTGPVTRAQLADDLGRLGVRPGSALLVHTSLSALGWVCGGAQTVVEALLDALGPDGTLVVPTHTNGNSDPAQWQAPPVPESWWQVIRDETPAFDPAITPSRGARASSSSSPAPGRAPAAPTTRSTRSPRSARPPRRSRRSMRSTAGSASARRWPGSTTSTATCSCSGPATAPTRRSTSPSTACPTRRARPTAPRSWPRTAGAGRRGRTSSPTRATSRRWAPRSTPRGRSRSAAWAWGRRG